MSKKVKVLSNTPSPGITGHKRAEEALGKTLAELEMRVEERTAQLTKANEELRIEIAVRKLAKEALRESEEFSSGLLTNSPNPILVINPDTSVRYVNPALEKLTGFTSTEITGRKTPYPWWTEETLQETSRDFEEALDKGIQKVDELFQKKNGERFWVEITATPARRDGEFKYYLANWVDITERKRAEETLEFSAKLLDSASDSIYVSDLDGNLIYVNETAYRSRGYSKEEMLSMNLNQLNVPEYAKLIKPRMQEMMREGQATFETAHFRKDKSIIPIEAHIRLIETGGKKLLLNIARDITERKQAEERVEHLNTVLRAIRNVNQLIAREKDRDRLLKGTCDILIETRGYYNAWIVLLDESGELLTHGQAGLGEKFLPMVERLKRGELAGCSRRALRQSEVVVTENPFSACTDCPLADKYRGRGAMAVRLEYEEKVYGILSVSIPRALIAEEEEQSLFREVASDIAFALHSIESEEKRKQAEELYRTLANSSPFGVYIVQARKFQFVNPQFQKYTGFAEDELLDMNPLGLVHPKDRETVRKNAVKMLKGNRRSPYEFRVISKGGETRWAMETVASIHYEGKRATLGNFMNITERKKMERELQERNEQLVAQQQVLIEKTEEVEKANQLKSEFLASVSHELRTPLNVIIGFSQLMTDEVPGGINEEQRRCLDDILGSSQHLLNLIKDVLDLSKIESGKVEFKLTNVALDNVIEPLARTMIPILAPRKQRLDIEIEEGLPLVHADKSKLRQVLLNLVTNSSKFTPDGGKLKIKTVREGDWCQVSVIDNGIGIKKEDQERIFEPFCQLDNPLTKERSGAGLGLAVAKQIIEKHGGRIWLESEYEKGSRFTFTLPLATSG